VTRLWAERCRVWILGHFSLLQNIQTGSGTPPRLIFSGYCEGLSPGVRRPEREADRSNHLVPWLRKSGGVPPLCLPSCCVQGQSWMVLQKHCIYGCCSELHFYESSWITKWQNMQLSQGQWKWNFLTQFTVFMEFVPLWRQLKKSINSRIIACI